MAHLQTFDTPYEPKDYDRLRGLEGFSEDLMQTHIGLYAGYVEHTNKAHGLIRTGDLDDYSRGEVRRRMVWEFNGMRLHELYFDALTPGGTERTDDSPLVQAIENDFGGFDVWMEDFRSVGAMRGIGWAALSYDPVQERFFDHWIDEHDAGALAGTHPILLMDVFEHAFMRDFGTDKQAYMDAYFGNVDWNQAEARFLQARS